MLRSVISSARVAQALATAILIEFWNTLLSCPARERARFVKIWQIPCLLLRDLPTWNKSSEIAETKRSGARYSLAVTKQPTLLACQDGHRLWPEH
jgi:hypothetical protein